MFVSTFTCMKYGKCDCMKYGFAFQSAIFPFSNVNKTSQHFHVIFCVYLFLTFECNHDNCLLIYISSLFTKMNEAKILCLQHSQNLFLPVYQRNIFKNKYVIFMRWYPIQKWPPGMLKWPYGKALHRALVLICAHTIYKWASYVYLLLSSPWVSLSKMLYQAYMTLFQLTNCV